MNIAFLYIAEPYQCYHGASLALALEAYAGVHVVNYYNFPETQEHLKRISRAMDAPEPEMRFLERSFSIKMHEAAKRLDRVKLLLLRQNAEELNQYDALVATEYTAGILRKLGVTRPKLILVLHGAGDRLVDDEALMRDFDFILLPGPKVEQYSLQKNLVRQGHYATVGLPRMDVCAAMQHDYPVGLFSNANPFVLYNAHCKRKLSSLQRFMPALFKGFQAQSRYNLVVAPHIKTFHKSLGMKTRFMKRYNAPTIHVDTYSDRLIDMTYTTHADIYVGDVSSQVYEFLVKPRPCVFLNTSGVNWRNNPHFLHWNLGEVVEQPEEVMRAIMRAHAVHARYRSLQEKLVKESLGDPVLGASKRGASAIMRFMKQRDG
ncbi:hypothetical protein AA0312_0540 [Acetobacter tropicalis NRIC 0312]|uniref:Glycerophosphotransferase n=1 Tax=Acetobacter tropicalis TaxID=104102 RepID=A0A511FMJ7_9PROT|nr:hypothetical protein [Acetobacter tropicalis]KXV50660.1 hypothetical protein AD944_04425 [Acetobacter tropicalis]GAL98047.1 glycosyl/glycerophosphate transferase, teichoic acid biosynthesis [Acetobacter tropicalis]GBR67663.1 hypothetical protein AA0312_0540 [Acetobacter tropicalis NRIC 0312]GEL50184.1 glycerophosphotransferase [Acetobacter tropicalis]